MSPTRLQPTVLKTPTAARKNATASKPNADSSQAPNADSSQAPNADSSQASNIPDPPPANNPQDLVANSKTAAASTNLEGNTLQLRPPTQDPRNSQDEKASTHNTAATYTKTRAATRESVNKPTNANESPAFDAPAFATRSCKKQALAPDNVHAATATSTPDASKRRKSQAPAHTLNNADTSAALSTSDFSTAPQAQDILNIDTVPGVSVAATSQVQDAVKAASPDTKNAATTLQAQSTVKAAANTADIKTTADIVQLQGLSTTVAPQAQETVNAADLDTVQPQDFSATTAPQAQAINITTPQDTTARKSAARTTRKSKVPNILKSNAATIASHSQAPAASANSTAVAQRPSHQVFQFCARYGNDPRSIGLQTDAWTVLDYVQDKGRGGRYVYR